MNKENLNIKDDINKMKNYKKLGDAGMLIMALGVLVHIVYPSLPEILILSMIIGIPSMMIADYKVFFKKRGKL